MILTSASERARAAYDAASELYDDRALAFWDRFGRRTVERLALRPGERVLDVCCGSGASALPAAERVGPAGAVLGVDLSERLIALGRAKAAARGLDHLRFQTGDLTALELPAGSFDAVACIFGLFFAPDMASALGGLWRLLAPGGRLAITTWGPRLFAPADRAFWDAVADVRPELHRGFNPWDRISAPAGVLTLFAEAGLPIPTVETESSEHPLATADDWWTIVLGSGYRGTVDAMTAEEQERVRAANLSRLEGVASIETNVLYAFAAR